MKILKNKRDGFTIQLEIEEDYSEVEKQTEPAFRELNKDVHLPGFRPGKAPRHIFEKRFGQGMILERAADLVLNNCYRLTLKQENLSPVDYPRDVKIKTFEPGKPLCFSLTIDVVPEVKLKKYKGLKVKKEETEVKESDIEEQINRLRENYAEYQEVERPIQQEDIVKYDLKASIGDQPLEIWTRKDSGTKVGLKSIDEAFDQALIGVKKNEAKSFSLKIKPDHFVKEAAGQEVKFEVLVTSIKEKKLKELTNEMIKEISGKENLEELKKEIREHLTKSRAQELENKFKDEVVKELISNNDLELPKAMVENEIEVMLNNLRNQLSQSKLKLEDYVSLMGRTVDKLKDEYRPVATDRVKSRLLLEEIAKEEKIVPAPEDFARELDKIARETKQNPVDLEKNLNPQVREYINHYLTEEKTLDFVVNNVKIK